MCLCMLFTPYATFATVACPFLLLALVNKVPVYGRRSLSATVELQWLEYLWNRENMFETGVVQANECIS